MSTIISTPLIGEAGGGDGGGGAGGGDGGGDAGGGGDADGGGKGGGEDGGGGGDIATTGSSVFVKMVVTKANIERNTNFVKRPLFN